MDRLTTLDEFLAEGKRKEFDAIAFKEVLAWQLDNAMKEKKNPKRSMAEHKDTSRS